MHFPYLSLLIGIPFIGVLFLLLVKQTASRNAKSLAFWVSIVNALLACLMLYHFNSANPDFQFLEKYIWIESLKCSYHVGVDGLSVYFVWLSAILTPICIMSAASSIKERVREFMIAFLALESMMIGVFCALDLIFFYVFFEAVLLPMFMIIGIWGGKNRLYACFKFFLYTFFGSVFMLIALVKLFADTGTSNLLDIVLVSIPKESQYWMFLCFAFAMAIKIPMFPFHTWLPDAHTEAPTAGSVILAGILLKMGGYGFLRIVIPILPDACAYFAFYMNILSVMGIVYGAFAAMAQTDMKKMIAYSSVSHMGFVTLGIFSLSEQGYVGAVFQMISHGIISSALFLCVDVLYTRFHTREIAFYGGAFKLMPVYCSLFFLIMLGSIGLPGTSGFVGEFLVLLSAFKANHWLLVSAVSGVVMGAVYMLWLYKKVFLGKVSATLQAYILDNKQYYIQKSDSYQYVKLDLKKRERMVLGAMILLMLALGVYPNIITPTIQHVYPKIYLENFIS